MDHDHIKLRRIINGQIELGKQKDEIITYLNQKGYQEKDFINLLDACLAKSRLKNKKKGTILLSIGIFILLIASGALFVPLPYYSGDYYFEANYYYIGGFIVGPILLFLGIQRILNK